MNTEVKKLYKSDTDVIVWGILGGIGEYFAIDPTVLRLGYIILALVTGIFPCIIAYIIAYFIIPEKPHALALLKDTPVSKDTKEHITKTETEEIKKEMDMMDITMAEKEKFAPGERNTPDTTEELAIPEDIGELKKPDWHLSTDKKETDAPTEEKKGVHLDDILEK